MHEILQSMFEGEDPKSIFEVGCASSWFLENYRTHKEVPVGGLDIDAANVLISQQRFPQFAENFIVHDATQTPWPIETNSWDTVITIGTLLLIPDPFPVIKEMLRIAKRKIILAEYQDDSKDIYGDQGKIPQPQNPYDLRIRRDYIKVFKKLKLPIQMSSGNVDKTVIKCNATR